MPDEQAPNQSNATANRREDPPMVPTPASVDAWMPALQKTGFVGLTFLLVWVLLSSLRSDVTEIKAVLAAHVVSTAEREKSDGDRDKLLKSVVSVITQQCVNAAQTTAKVDACFMAVNFDPVRNPK